jgi:hypothetical protein
MAIQQNVTNVTRQIKSLTFTEMGLSSIDFEISGNIVTFSNGANITAMESILGMPVELLYTDTEILVFN